MDFLWVYILGIVSAVSIISFIMTFSKDVKLVQKLRLNKKSLMINFSLLVSSSISIGLVIYLFSLLKNQIDLIG